MTACVLVLLRWGSCLWLARQRVKSSTLPLSGSTPRRSTRWGKIQLLDINLPHLQSNLLKYLWSKLQSHPEVRGSGLRVESHCFKSESLNRLIFSPFSYRDLSAVLHNRYVALCIKKGVENNHIPELLLFKSLQVVFVIPSCSVCKCTNLSKSNQIVKQQAQFRGWKNCQASTLWATMSFPYIIWYSSAEWLGSDWTCELLVTGWSV